VTTTPQQSGISIFCLLPETPHQRCRSPMLTVLTWPQYVIGCAAAADSSRRRMRANIDGSNNTVSIVTRSVATDGPANEQVLQPQQLLERTKFS
jgi:hypothetical protein